MLSIGGLSKQTGVHIETIRFYERAGVLPRPLRTSTRRRLYDAADVSRLVFIRHARELGFDLKSVRALLELQQHPERSCNSASDLAATLLDAVESRLSRLRKLRVQLSGMIGTCANGKASECSVLEALAQPELRAFASNRKSRHPHA